MDVHRRHHGGTVLTVSVATPAHAPAIVVLYASLSEQSQRRRFAGGMSFDAFAAVAALDPDAGAVAVVASEGARLVGEARYFPTTDGAHELVVTVADDHQGQGLGGHLVDRLREEAARRGVLTLRAVVPVDHEPMVRLLRRRGAVISRPMVDGDLVLLLTCETAPVSDPGSGAICDPVVDRSHPPGLAGSGPFGAVAATARAPSIGG